MVRIILYCMDGWMEWNGWISDETANGKTQEKKMKYVKNIPHAINTKKQYYTIN